MLSLWFYCSTGFFEQINDGCAASKVSTSKFYAFLYSPIGYEKIKLKENIKQ